MPVAGIWPQVAIGSTDGRAQGTAKHHSSAHEVEEWPATCGNRAKREEAAQAAIRKYPAYPMPGSGIPRAMPCYSHFSRQWVSEGTRGGSAALPSIGAMGA